MRLCSTVCDHKSTRSSWSCSITLFTLTVRRIPLFAKFALKWRYLNWCQLFWGSSFHSYQHKNLLHKIVSFLHQLIYLNQMFFWLSVLFWISSWHIKVTFPKRKCYGCKVFLELTLNKIGHLITETNGYKFRRLWYQNMVSEK